MWQHLHEAGGGGLTTIALAGLDLALWDAAARADDAPAIAALVTAYNTTMSTLKASSSYNAETQTASALRIAQFLEDDPRVKWVKYPFLQSHPQYELATSQMTGGGTVVTFELNDRDDVTGKLRAFEVLDKLAIVDISNNLGDSKSLITHPATTTHMRIGAEERAKLGIGDGTVRLSIGLEDRQDLIEDLETALAATRR